MHLDYWPSDDSVVWLRKVDLVLSVGLLGPQPEVVLEIGVFRGGWLLSLLRNRPSSLGIGIDPYPNMPELADEIHGRIERLGLGSRVKMFSTLDPIVTDSESARRFRLIHVDGEHTYDAVSREIQIAKSLLKHDGVIIIDDYRHPYFPGIAAAMYEELLRGELHLVAVTQNKAYLTYVDCAPHIRQVISEIAREQSLILELSLPTHEEHVNYSQPSYVFDQEVLLLVNDGNYTE